ncbi:MAG: TlyA family rRNA (cytidine-2'-O)-methyltransferase [Candidatus Riflebacteria bacterium HGW-Riflebacteria-1]|jgi:23S rRNA (cytidine1920-2'-O)/16S rRNA (cytidine1409-2'-O)-methyltransferase|nr:MAG: TlyA family rRNA (cytidine-2'-O)-methyltransferase [Candidatus Riflebacteria bacterium HGW-Riflebacteria-1]
MESKMAKKARADELVVLQGLAPDLLTARRLIMAGEIRSGDHVWEKAGEKLSVATVLVHKPKHCRWVSRGGLKLERAFAVFDLQADGLRCLDIGASTGGFTDVLLHNGAREVVAVDVGYGLLDARLQNDPRVIVKDRTNFKLVADTEFGEAFDLAVTDVSFISLRQILPKAAVMLKDAGSLLALIKPQFEAEREQVPEGGIVIDPQVHLQVILSLQEFLNATARLYLHELVPVPRVDPRKNIEFLSHWKKTQQQFSAEKISEIIASAHASKS